MSVSRASNGGSEDVATPRTGARTSASLHGNVNILLGGAMLTGVIVVVFLMCYCCHRNMRKTALRNAQYWREETELPLEVFTVDGQCYEVSGTFLSSDSCGSLDSFTCAATPTPPPSYDAIITRDVEKMDADAGLPSYEAALEAIMYV